MGSGRDPYGIQEATVNFRKWLEAFPCLLYPFALAFLSLLTGHVDIFVPGGPVVRTSAPWPSGLIHTLTQFQQNLEAIREIIFRQPGRIFLFIRDFEISHTRIATHVCVKGGQGREKIDKISTMITEAE